MMKRLSVLFAVLFGCGSAAIAQQNLTLQVQLHYTGSGTVDATHKIYVALWDSPELNRPTEVKSATSKDGMVTFSDVKKSPAYVSAAYDPTSKWDGASGPPPSGASLGMYSKAPPKPDPITLTPEKVAKITISFGDTTKVP